MLVTQCLKSVDEGIELFIKVTRILCLTLYLLFHVHCLLYYSRYLRLLTDHCKVRFLIYMRWLDTANVILVLRLSLQICV